MIIYIDGDSCPVIENTINIAKINNLKVILVKDFNHKIDIVDDNVEIITIEQGTDSADLYILNKVKEHDILISNDIGLSSIALSKKAYILNFYGKVLNDFNIDQLLFERHINKLNRKNNIYSTKFKKRTKEDNLHFEQNLIELIKTATLK